MGNKFQIKRTAVTGREPTTGNIDTGELAINITDGIMYSTNGTTVFEIGANNTNVNITDTLTVETISANGTVGTDGQVLTSNGSSVYWSTSSGGGGIEYITKTANYTASDKDGIIADTSGGSFTITLPATPSTGNQVHIVDGDDWSNNNLTVARNGSTIEGTAEDLTVDIGGIGLIFIYDGSTWEIVTQGIGIDTNTNYLSSVDIGVNVQAYDSDLDTWSTKTAPSGTVVGTTDTQTLTNKTISAADNTLTGVTTLTGTQTLTNKTLEGATLDNGYTEEVFAVTGTTPALSPTNGSIQTWTLSGSSTPTAGTWADGQSMTMMIDDGSASTVTWTTLAVTWKTDAGSAPTLNTTGYTAIAFWKVGSTIYGARVGDN